MSALDFYKGKKVFITGHTGFKGAWMCRILTLAGADVTGYALEPPTAPSLFSLTGSEKYMRSVIGDIRDVSALISCMKHSQAEIAFHMAAQAIVRRSYVDPRTTYETNVMGTVNFMEAIKACETVKSAVVVTTDKVYQNQEWDWGYRENDLLDGYDPYSNSKSCAELITRCYNRAVFSSRETAISTARAGNVIGGGDFAEDRIIPDCVRAAAKGEWIRIRNPNSIRPYQHVVEAISAYTFIAEKQFDETSCAGTYNVGPEDHDLLSTGELAQLFCEKWGEGLKWVSDLQPGPHEAHCLKLDCSKIKNQIGWRPKWNVDTAIGRTVDWTKAYIQKDDFNKVMDEQIKAYFKLE